MELLIIIGYSLGDYGGECLKLCIRVIVLLLGCVLGGISYELILNIVFTTGDSILTTYNPWLTIFSSVSLIAIFLGYGILSYLISKKQNKKNFLTIALIVLFSSLILMSSIYEILSDF